MRRLRYRSPRFYLWRAWLLHPIGMWRSRKERALWRRQFAVLLNAAMEEDAWDLIEEAARLKP